MKITTIGLRQERPFDKQPGYIEIFVEKHEIPYIEKYLGLEDHTSQNVIARRIESGGNTYIRIEHI